MIRKFDESFTDLLTKFCWWSDINFGKDNVWWANTIFIFLYPIVDAIAAFFVEGQKVAIMWHFLEFVL